MKSHLIQLLIVLIPTVSMSQMNSSIDFILGLENSYRSLKTASDEITILDLVAFREEKEFHKLNWRIGINYNKRLTNNLLLKSGIRLASVGYKNEKQTDLRWPSEIGPNGYMFDPSLPHEIQFSYDYWFLEIPLCVRFEFSQKKISPFVEIGVSPSVYLFTRTKSDTDIGSEVTYRRGGTSDYNNMHIVGFGSIGANYEINEKIQLFGQALYRYHFTSLVDAPIEENLYNYGVEIGIRRKLN